MNDFGQEMKIVIDLDAERNIQPREGRTPNVHTIIIRKAKPLNLSVIDGYLSGSMSFDNSVLEAISRTRKIRL